MFSPTYQLNAELDENLEEIERLKYRIERNLLMPKHEEWLRREAFIRNVYSSTMVENATITEKEMEEAAKPLPVVAVSTKRPDVINYASALKYVDFLSDSDTPWTQIPQNTLLHIHWTLMQGIDDVEVMPGSFRTKPNWIADQGVRVFESPMPIDVPILMREFTDWLKDGTDTMPILAAGIAHLHLVAIHPFVDGNGRTARLLATLILQRARYGFRKLLSLDAYYQRNRDAYIDALRDSLGRAYSPNYDATPWLVFFTQSIIGQAKSLERRLTDWRITVESIHSEWGKLGLKEREIDGLIYAARMGKLTRKDYVEIAGVSGLTGTKDLQRLAKMGLLEPRGKKRSKHYVVVALPEAVKQANLL